MAQKDLFDVNLRHLLHYRIRFCNVWWVHVEIRWSLLHARSNWAANLGSRLPFLLAAFQFVIGFDIPYNQFFFRKKKHPINVLCISIAIYRQVRYQIYILLLKYSVLLTSTWQYCTVDDEHEDEVPWSKNQSNANCKDNSNDWI